MKKVFFVLVFVVVLGGSLCAQTWTERRDTGSLFGEVDYTYTVITKQQYDRLLGQHTALGEYGEIHFFDNLELDTTARIISGRKPTFNGYYYLLGKLKPISASVQQMAIMSGMETGLIYGNSNTGSVAISFGNALLASDTAFPLNSTAFTQRYTQCIRLVNGN